MLEKFFQFGWKDSEPLLKLSNGVLISETLAKRSHHKEYPEKHAISLVHHL
jgi:hypothetical protein